MSIQKLRWRRAGAAALLIVDLAGSGCALGGRRGHAVAPPVEPPVEPAARPADGPAADSGAGSLAAGAELLGTAELPSGFEFADTAVGGLSGLAYDRERDVFYAISDDRSEHGPARFYTLRVDLGAGRLDPGEVAVVGVTTLIAANGRSFPAGTIDAEGIALVGGDLFVSSEGAADRGIAPFVRRFGLDGRQRGRLPLPAYWLPDVGSGVGVRDNLALESLTATPDGALLFTASENALAQDGPAADLDTGSPARLLVWDLGLGVPVGEYVYPVEPVARAPALPGLFRVNGLVELLALDRASLLALERSYSAGAGYALRLYRISLAGATNVFATPRLGDAAGVGGVDGGGRSVRPVAKVAVVDVGELLRERGVGLDNLEGMALGPPLADGRRTLLLVADDNFSAGDQRTLFVFLALPASL
jgi:3-phytase